MRSKSQKVVLKLGGTLLGVLIIRETLLFGVHFRDPLLS